MHDKFTERVRKVIYLAREEAARLQHDYIGTEHLLLGVIREGEGSPPPCSTTSAWISTASARRSRTW